MKKVITLLVALACTTTYLGAQSANTTLSNLTTPVAVNLSLLPQASKTLDLGSKTYSWRNLNLSGNIYKGGVRVFSTSNGNIAVGDNSLISNTTGNANTATGYYALYKNTTGLSNTANGYRALNYNTTGTNNTGVGVAALGFNTTGSFNSATGDSSLAYNTTGINNTATGKNALYRNTSGERNAAHGSYALFSNTTGSWNLACGAEALYANTTGYFNTASGFYALNHTTTGHRNTAAGSYSMYYNTTGYQNSGFGVDALNANTSGSSNAATGFEALRGNTTGFSNTASGAGALRSNIDGAYNTATGYQSMFSNTGAYNIELSTGSYNTSMGSAAMYSNTIGACNTAVGYGALYSNTDGFSNTAVGYNAGYNSTNLSDATAIGAGAQATTSHQVMLGSTYVTSVRAAGSYVIYSDGRFKKNIKENVPGLDFIKQLRPVTYNYDIHKLNDYIKPANQSKQSDKESDQIKKIREEAINNKEKKTYTGFVAQEVEKIADKMGFDFSGVYKPQNDKDPFGLSYSDFVVPLVKAVQELSKTNDEKDTKIEALEKRIEKLEALVSTKLATNSNTQSISFNDASLEQNTPNPFRNSTIIHYTLPQQFSKAIILVTEKSGKTIKEINVSGSGKGTLNLDASSLASGTYQYSLYVNGRMVKANQMLLVK